MLEEAEPRLPRAGLDLDPAADVLQRLQEGRRIGGRAVLVAAHPDDETLGLGGVMHLLADLHLVQLTDGAPADPADRRAAGCASREAYAALREREAQAALQALGLKPLRTRLGLLDQGVVDALEPLSRLLAERLCGAALVFTHAYEGGHPDHDAAAFAVQSACALMNASGERAPMRLEFAGYHRGAEGGRIAGRFWSDPRRPEAAVALGAAERSRKASALAAYASQAGVVDWFPAGVERFRVAPDYAFDRPPPPGGALYDGFGWPLTSAVWRARAAAAQAALSGQAGRA